MFQAKKIFCGLQIMLFVNCIPDSLVLVIENLPKMCLCYAAGHKWDSKARLNCLKHTHIHKLTNKCCESSQALERTVNSKDNHACNAILNQLGAAI